jgi:hypothetical protein
MVSKIELEEKQCHKNTTTTPTCTAACQEKTALAPRFSGVNEPVWGGTSASHHKSEAVRTRSLTRTANVGEQEVQGWG